MSNANSTSHRNNTSSKKRLAVVDKKLTVFRGIPLRLYGQHFFLDPMLWRLWLLVLRVHPDMLGVPHHLKLP